MSLPKHVVRLTPFALNCGLACWAVVWHEALVSRASDVVAEHAAMSERCAGKGEKREDLNHVCGRCESLRLDNCSEGICLGRGTILRWRKADYMSTIVCQAYRGRWSFVERSEQSGRGSHSMRVTFRMAMVASESRQP